MSAPNAEQLKQRIDALRNAWELTLCDMSPEKIIMTMSKVSRMWQKDGRWYPRAMEAKSRYPFDMVKPSLERFLRGMEGSEVNSTLYHDWRSVGASSYLFKKVPEIGYPVSAHILAGNVPLLGWENIVASLIAHSCPFLKLSSQETAWVPLLVDSIREVDPKLAQCIDFEVWPGAEGPTAELLSQADCVVAYGSDETITTLRDMTPTSSPFYGYANRFSAAWISQKEANERSATLLAQDCSRYFQLGCLSPQIVFVEGDSLAYAELLAGKIEAEISAYPIELTFDEAVSVRREREAANFVACSRQWGDPKLTWTVIHSDRPIWNLLGVFGTTNICPVSSIEQVIEQLKPYNARMQAIGYAGKLSKETKAALNYFNIPLICQIGTMQTPPFGWHADGRSLLLSFLQRSEIEW